jgi:hypothetical protein
LNCGSKRLSRETHSGIHGIEGNSGHVGDFLRAKALKVEEHQHQSLFVVEASKRSKHKVTRLGIPRVRRRSNPKAIEVTVSLDHRMTPKPPIVGSQANHEPVEPSPHRARAVKAVKVAMHQHEKLLRKIFYFAGPNAEATKGAAYIDVFRTKYASKLVFAHDGFVCVPPESSKKMKRNTRSAAPCHR